MEREGNSLSHRLAVCDASDCFSVCEVHGEFWVKNESQGSKLREYPDDEVALRGSEGLR